MGGNKGLVPAGFITVPVAGGAKETIHVVETFCINATTVAGCAPANTGTISGSLTVSGTTTGTFTTFVFTGCSAGATVGTCNGGASGSSIALSNLTSSIGVSDQFTLTKISGNQSVLTLDNIGNAFDEFAAASTAPGTLHDVLVCHRPCGKGLPALPMAFVNIALSTRSGHSGVLGRIGCEFDP
jgi:hypothetical protein